MDINQLLIGCTQIKKVILFSYAQNHDYLFANLLPNLLVSANVSGMNDGILK